MFKKFHPTDPYLQHIYSIKSNPKSIKRKFLDVLFPIVGDLARGVAKRQAQSKFDPYGRPRFWGVSDFDRR